MTVRGGGPRRRTGRRFGDPVEVPVSAGSVAVHGRLAGVSIRASVVAGGWVGFALGLTIGAMAGGVTVWFTGAILDWQRDLAFTLGIARSLLPFGDQAATLRWIQSSWYLVIPAIGLLGGFGAAILGGLIGGISAAAYNHSPRHAVIVVELPEDRLSPAEPPPAAPNRTDEQ